MKNKRFLLLFLLSAALLTMEAQDNRYVNTYVCDGGKIHFFSSTPLENIDAVSNNAVCVLNTETKKVYAKVQMVTFSFGRKLMQEHFNENYMETDQYPFGILDAVIEENLNFTKDGTYPVTLKGTFEVHGVKQTREIAGQLTIVNGQPKRATATFTVNLADHNIAIPKAVIMKVAESTQVDVDFTFEKYKKS